MLTCHACRQGKNTRSLVAHDVPFLLSVPTYLQVTGVLRGFDQFMNIVLDETIDEVSQDKNDIGLVVSSLLNQFCPLPVNESLRLRGICR